MSSVGLPDFPPPAFRQRSSARSFDKVQIAGYSKHASELAERLRSQPVYEVLRAMPYEVDMYEVSDGLIHPGSELRPAPAAAAEE